MLLICSGGDDQALAFQRFVVRIQGSIEANIDLAMQTRSQLLSQVVTVKHAAGAAFKGVCVLSQSAELSELSIAAVAYDQRLSIWSLRIDNTIAFCSLFAELDEHNNGEDVGHDASQKSSGLDGNQIFPKGVDQSMIVQWDKGVLVHVAEVSSMYIAHLNQTNRAVVVGEGFQVLNLSR
jgi:hypothetical protein